MQAYSDPSRAGDPHALPDVEVFYHDAKDNAPGTVWELEDEPGTFIEDGWYYWPCFPGCLPDGEPVGPFASKQEALNAAQEDDNN